jgi:hypothetical protein
MEALAVVTYNSLVDLLWHIEILELTSQYLVI